jgi:hypothetical protein
MPEVLYIYHDAGICGDDIYTWNGGGGTFDADFDDQTAPEGSKSFLTNSDNWQDGELFLQI